MDFPGIFERRKLESLSTSLVVIILPKNKILSIGNALKRRKFSFAVKKTRKGFSWGFTRNAKYGKINETKLKFKNQESVS